MRRRELITGAGALALYRVLPAHGAIVGSRRAALLGGGPPIISVISSAASAFYSSTNDGKNWFSAATFPTGSLLSLAYSPAVRRFAALGSGANGFYGQDSRVWVPAANYPTVDHWNQTRWLSSKNWFCGIGGKVGGLTKNVALSSDGNDFFVAASLPVVGNWRAMDFSPTLGGGFGRVVALSSTSGGANVAAAYSDDAGQTWSAGSIASGITWSAVKWIPFLNLFLATSNGTAYATSVDGIIFITAAGSLPASASTNGQSIACSSSQVCVLSQSLGTMTSPDVSTWTNNSGVFSVAMVVITYSYLLGLYVAVGNGPTYWSPGGALWTPGMTLAADLWGSIATTG